MSEAGLGERSGPLARRVGWAVGLGGFVLLLVWPDLGLDRAQRGVAAVTALTAALWLGNVVPVGAASLVPAALMPLLGVLPAKEVATLYMHDIVLLFLGAFMLALGLQRWGVHRRIALAIVDRIGTSPRRVVLGFMIASAALSMWISNTATTLLMLPIGMAVIATLEPDEGADGPLSVCLLLGIAYSSSIGGTATLVGTAPNMAFRSVFAETFPEAPELAFGGWMRDWLPLTLLFVPASWWLMTRWLAPVGARCRDAGEEIAAARRAQGPMSRGQVLMTIVFFGTALLWVTREDLELGFARVPGWEDWITGVEGATIVSDATVAVFMALVAFAIPVDRAKGVHLLDWSTAVKLPWEILLLFGGGLCLARGFDASGLASRIGEGLAPLLAGQPVWLVVYCTALLLSFLTEVTSNTATTFVLLPVAAQGAVAAGLNPTLVMMPATIAASLAFMMPVATPPNAIVFSSGRFRLPTMARVGFVLNFLGVVLLTLVFELWVRRFGGLERELPAWAGG